jgi:hypothetical protein
MRRMIGFIFTSGKQTVVRPRYNSLFLRQLDRRLLSLFDIVTLAAVPLMPEWRQVQDAGFQVICPFKVRRIDYQCARLATASR